MAMTSPLENGTGATVVLPRPVLPTDWNLAQLQEHLGGIPLERIRLYPPPGMATEQDVLDLETHHDVLCELVDGILVEKEMGLYEARLAAILIFFIEQFLQDHNLGITLTPDGPVRLLKGQVRMPDVSFVRHERLPPIESNMPRILPLAPNLAIEILSRSNTSAEMQRKRQEYFAAGVEAVWEIDAARRTARTYTSAEDGYDIAANEFLQAETVLPEFRLKLSDLFARAERKPMDGNQ